MTPNPKDASVHADIVFRYFPTLQLVTAEVRCACIVNFPALRVTFVPLWCQAESRPYLLTCLFPGDDGDVTPRLSNRHIVLTNGSVVDVGEWAAATL